MKKPKGFPPIEPKNQQENTMNYLDIFTTGNLVSINNVKYTTSEVQNLISQLTTAKLHAEEESDRIWRQRDEFERKLCEIRHQAKSGHKINAIKDLREAWKLVDPEGKPMDLWIAKTMVENLCG